jgi:uncharacterized protein (TIGR00369 family)
MSMAFITHRHEANPFGTLHGGVILRFVDECGAIVAMRHAGGGRVTTAAIDSMTFLGPVHPGERVEIDAVVTYVGRSSIETHIEVHAEPLAKPERRKVGAGYALYVALDAAGKPRAVPPLSSETDAERARDAAAHLRQSARLARREEAKEGR